MTNQRDNIGLQQLHVYINLSILRLIIILKSIDCCSRISPIMIIVYHSYLVEPYHGIRIILIHWIQDMVLRFYRLPMNNQLKYFLKQNCVSFKTNLRVRIKIRWRKWYSKEFFKLLFVWQIGIWLTFTLVSDFCCKTHLSKYSNCLFFFLEQLTTS